MKMSDQGVIALLGHEGIVPGPYYDSEGVMTYGVGHTAAAGRPDPKSLAPGMPENLDAELLRVFATFRADLVRYEAEVDAAIKVPVSQPEFDAATSFHFNTGAIGHATWVKKLNAGDRGGAAAAIMNWTKPRAIIPRRRDEQRIFRDGVYPNSTITVWRVANDRQVIWQSARRLGRDESLRLLRGVIIPDVEPISPISPNPFAAFFAALKRMFQWN